MEEVSGMNFADTALEIDGNHYIDCTFPRCTFEYRATDTVGFEACTFDGNTWLFDGPARYTVMLLQDIYHGIPDGRAFVDTLFTRIQNAEFE